MSTITAIPGLAQHPARAVDRDMLTTDRTAIRDQTGSQENTIDPTLVADATAELADALKQIAYEPLDVVLRWDSDRRTPVIEIRDPESGELLRQFPPEEILKMRGNMVELLGTVIDRTS